MTTDLIIYTGKTFSRVIRWAAAPYIYKAITAITKAAPVSITSASHGLVSGWRVAVVSVGGMTQINAQNFPPRTNEYHKATVVDPNTITLNDVNSAGYSTYTSGGYLQYLTPVDMTGYSARMSIKDKVGGTELLRLSTANGRIAIDNTNKTITLNIESAATAAITWTTGVYDLEMVAAPISAGAFVVGHTYVIVSIGTTDFTLIGATANTVGLSFTATGIGSGTGTVEGTVDLLLSGSIIATNEVTTT